MSRDTEALKIRPWADAGQREIPELKSDPISRDTGWTLEYALPGGPTISRPLMNQMFREITGMLAEVNTSGIPAWSPWVSYVHVAFVRWRGGLYRSLCDSGPAYGGSFIPSAPDQDAWRRH